MSTPTPAPAAGATVLPTTAAPRRAGTIARQADAVCPQDSDGQCKRLLVACPGIADANAQLRITGRGTRGTIVLFTGATGTAWSRPPPGVQGGEHAIAMMDAFLADGFRIVEVRWLPPGVWEGPGGSVSAACRSAAVLRWIHANIHRDGLFAAQGNSGGAAQIAFSLAYYGLGDLLQLAQLSGGPPPCPVSTNGSLNYGEQQHCVAGAPGFLAAREPILTGTPVLDYPRTSVRFFIGANEPSSYIVQSARAYHSAITSDKRYQTVPNAAHEVHHSRDGAQAMLASLREFAQPP